MTEHRKRESGMARSGRKCANEHCSMFEAVTGPSVCRHCHRATVLTIYRPTHSESPAQRGHRSGSDL